MQGRIRGARGVRALLTASGALAAVAVGSGAAFAAPGDAFTISGNVDRLLYPGTSGSLNLSLTNLGDTQLTVGEISARVASVTTTSAQPCLAADFVITQLDATRQFTLPARATRTLTDLGVAVADLPQVSMTNTSVNQDGCKLATINLAYSGRAAEVGGVTIPPATPTPQPSPSDDGVVRGVRLPGPSVGGVHLPGTGAGSDTFWVILGGLGLIALGTGSVVLTRRTKGAQQ